MSIDLIYFLLVYVAVFLLLPAMLCAFIKKEIVLKNIICVFLILNLAAIIALWLMPTDFDSQTVTLEFAFSGQALSKNFIFDQLPENLYSTITNLVLLLPLGLYITMLSKATLTKRALFGLLGGVTVGTIIELMQLVVPTSSSARLYEIVLFAISGLLGGILGSGLVALRNYRTRKFEKNRYKPQTVQAPTMDYSVPQGQPVDPAALEGEPYDGDFE